MSIIICCLVTRLEYHSKLYYMYFFYLRNITGTNEMYHLDLQICAWKSLSDSVSDSVYSKTCSFNGHSKRTPKIGFQVRLSLNQRPGSLAKCSSKVLPNAAILLTFIKLRPLFCLCAIGILRQG